MRIFVVTHKPVLVPDDRCYEPIQAGAAGAKNFGILGDDLGPNISELNPVYSELTAHFWIWKNVHCDRVGLVHYRRYFAPLREKGLVHLGKLIAAESDLEASLKEYDMVLVEPFSFHHAGTNIPQTVEQQYVSAHGFGIFQARRAIEIFSKEYLSSFDFVMRNNKLYAFNLMIAHKELFNNYMEWAFGVFSVIDSLVTPDLHGGYQARVQAFMSERLLTTWIVHNLGKLRIEHRKHVFFGGV